MKMSMNSGELAEAVRSACLTALLEAYEDAGVRGLCPEGRWEAAIGTLRTLDLQRLLEQEHTRTAERSRTAHDPPAERQEAPPLPNQRFQQ